jgi:hypothetical protein
MGFSDRLLRSRLALIKVNRSCYVFRRRPAVF